MSPIYIALEPHYVKVVEDRPIMSVEYRIPLLAKTDPPYRAVSLRSLNYLFILLWLGLWLYRTGLKLGSELVLG